MSSIRVYIKDALYRVFTTTRGTPPPRQRAIEFEEDLFNHAKKNLCWDTVSAGSRYSYTDLGSPLLDELRDMELLDPQGLLALAYWTPEYNPEYSAFGPHFMHTYMPTGQVVDVCDRGSVAGFAALKIVHSHVQAESKVGQATHQTSAIVLGFEQTTITRDFKDCLPIPLQASAGAIVLSDKPSERCGCLIDAGIIPESEQHGGGFRLESFVKDLCDSHDVDLSRLTVLMPFASYGAKNWRYWSQVTGTKSILFQVRHVPSGIKSMRVFEMIHASLRSDLTRERPFALLIDEDVETLALGWTLFEGPHAWREDT